MLSYPLQNPAHLMQFLQHGFVSSHLTWRRLGQSAFIARQVVEKGARHCRLTCLLAVSSTPSRNPYRGEHLQVTHPVRTLENLARVALRGLETENDVVTMTSPVWVLSNAARPVRFTKRRAAKRLGPTYGISLLILPRLPQALAQVSGIES